MRIFVPYISTDNYREIKLKISIDGSKWIYPEKIPPTSNLNEIKVPLVGASLVKFSVVEFAVVSRPKRESFTIKDNIGNAVEIRPSNNENLIMRIPEGTFERNIYTHLKVDTTLASRVSSEPDLNHIQIATPLFGIEFDEYTQKDVTLDIKPNYIKKAEYTDSIHGRAIHQCANKLVTDMAVDDVIDKLQSKSIVTQQMINKIESRTTNEAKARELLELFKTASESGFKALVESLSEVKQGHLAQILQKTLTDLEESELGSDFEDIKSSKLQLVSSNDSKEWKLIKIRSNSNLPINTTICIPSKHRNFDLIGLVVPKSISDEEICQVANEIYQRLYQVPVRLIVKQHTERPSDLYIRCVEKSKSQDTQKEMENQGYKDGPEEMVELGLCDTEEVIFNASGNIKYLSGATQMSFFLNIDSAHLSFQIDVLNTEAQSLSRTYQGNLAYNVGDTPQSPPRSGSFLIHLRKEAQRYAQLTLDVQVKAAAKYLAWQLTKRGSPDPHDLYMKLCGDSKKVKVLKNRANREGNTERKCCEAFIMSWASQRPKQENKVKTLLESLKKINRDSLAKETDSFLKPFINGTLSDKSIKDFSVKLELKWEILAKKLGYDDEDIKALNLDFDNDRMKAVHLLDKWRLEDSTIELGTDITSFIVEAMDGII
nr:uncharacterized protein LOC117692795 isoform X1 [Crassostrea gigas]